MVPSVIFFDGSSFAEKKNFFDDDVIATLICELKENVSSVVRSYLNLASW